MEALEQPARQGRRRKGQTLAEFAVTLPILLILMFGIIEFGRIFQAWVTLQNSARAAARYTTTGNYNNDLYPVDSDSFVDDINSVVPCVEGDERGTRTVYQPNGPDGLSVDIYVGGLESLYATWYQGEDCVPSLKAHQSRREDLARILSIFDEARVGAAGLAIAEKGTNLSPATYDNPPIGEEYEDSELSLNRIPWYDIWRRPFPGDPDGEGEIPGRYYHHTGFDTRGYFDVVICSDRALIWSSGSSENRFITSLEASDSFGEYSPACILDESHTDAAAAGGLDNTGLPWIDPGGPGDPITIVITFNHPLVTPLGLSPYLQLQARRTAVNESFREARAVPGALPLLPGVGGSEVTPEVSPTTTEETTMEPSSTATEIPSATSTWTPTPEFSCDAINITTSGLGTPNIDMVGTDFRIEWENGNPQQTRITNVILSWPTVAAYDGMFPANMKLTNAAYWVNEDNVGPNPLDTNSVAAYVNGVFPTLLPFSRALWSVTFANGPTNIASYMNMYGFNGTRFYFDHPDSDEDCEKILEFTPPTGTPFTGTPSTPTPTPTAACVPGLLSVQFVSFESFGVVRVNVTNYRNVVARMVGFNIRWIQYDTSNPPQFNLQQVKAGGISPEDQASNLIWQAASGQDVTPPTIGSAGSFLSGSEGTWVTSLNIPPGATVPLWLDWDHVGNVTINSQYPASLSDYNGSQFIFLVPECDDGSGEPGGPAYETVTPPPQSTLAPSNTPAPPPTTAVPPSRTPITPSPTRPTNTAAPTNTATLTRTITPTSPPPTWTPLPTSGSGTGG